MAGDDIAPYDDVADEDVTLGDRTEELQLVTVTEEEDPINEPEREAMRNDRMSEPDTFSGPRDQQDPTLHDGENDFEDEDLLGSSDLKEDRDIPLGMHVIEPGANGTLDEEDIEGLKEIKAFEEEEDL